MMMRPSGPKMVELVSREKRTPSESITPGEQIIKKGSWWLTPSWVLAHSTSQFTEGIMQRPAGGQAPQLQPIGSV